LGSNTSPNRSERPSKAWPFTKWRMLRMGEPVGCLDEAFF
jgi:hypothetical protein